MDSLVLQDPVAYSVLPSAPQPSAPPADHLSSSARESDTSVITVRPEILTIRLESPEPVAQNRKWLGYCCFIIFVFLFGAFAFYHMMFGGRKN